MAVGLGSDFSCDPTNGLSRSLAVSQGPTAFVEAIFRRLTTPRGKLWYDPTYGLDVVSYLLDTASDAQIAAEVTAEVLKDARTIDCAVRVQRSGARGESLTISIDIRASDGRVHPMTINVTEATGAILIAQDPRAVSQ